jgi:hypothetical protein
MIRLGGIVELQAVGKPGQVIPNPYVRAFTPIKEVEAIVEDDHEVGMASGQLDYIIKSATELKSKLGEMEKNVPGWIQDHISKAHSYLHQANSGYHELGEGKVNEARGVNSISNDIQKVVNSIESELELYKKAKGTPAEKKHIDALKKLGAKKKELATELDKKIAGMHKDAELKVQENSTKIKSFLKK